LIISDTIADLTSRTELTIIDQNNTGVAQSITIYRTFNNNSNLLFFSNAEFGAWFEIDEINLIDPTDNTSIWYDGHFYGGNFSGIWLGGTFHYGTKDGLIYYPPPKYKWVVSNIQTSTSSPPPAF
jgi:hypothetical protein